MHDRPALNPDGEIERPFLVISGGCLFGPHRSNIYHLSCGKVTNVMVTTPLMPKIGQCLKGYSLLRQLWHMHRIFPDARGETCIYLKICHK